MTIPVLQLNISNYAILVRNGSLDFCQDGRFEF